jgi:hypothetical protein
MDWKLPHIFVSLLRHSDKLDCAMFSLPEMIPVRFLLASIMLFWLNSNSVHGQSLRNNFPEQGRTNFNVYCDPNGGNTGTCWTFDQNTPLDCEYASQDFIQCSLRSTRQKFICINYASYQFACRPEVDSGASSIQRKSIRSDLGNPLQQNVIPSQPMIQDQFNNDLINIFPNE